MTRIPDELPRFPLMVGPTPLQEMPRLRAELISRVGTCPHLFIKRDDLTGLGGGGNKTRKLEFLVGDAIEQGADTLITAGAVQSNHARQTAAAAARAGMQAHLVLFDTVGYEDPAYHRSGNVLLDHILGAQVHFRPATANAREVFEDLAKTISDDGGNVYVIPVGGSNAIGSTAYAEAFLEIESQATTQGIAVSRIVHASGSLGTQAGLLAGRALAESNILIDAISVSKPDRESLLEELLEIANQTAQRIGAKGIEDADVRVDFRQVGEGYGLPTQKMVSAVELLARTEGILLDPVYTGKAMAGLISNIESGEIDPSETVVFLHTGGMPGLFAYPGEFQAV